MELTRQIGTLFWLAELLVIGFAFLDALRRRGDAFPAADKQPKGLWVAITGIALAWMVVQFLTIGDQGWLGILRLAGLIAAIVYLVDVRPAVREIDRGGGRSRGGPYGPW